jgi:hypothetical protein
MQVESAPARWQGLGFLILILLMLLLSEPLNDYDYE